MVSSLCDNFNLIEIFLTKAVMSYFQFLQMHTHEYLRLILSVTDSRKYIFIITLW